MPEFATSKLLQTSFAPFISNMVKWYWKLTHISVGLVSFKWNAILGVEDWGAKIANFVFHISFEQCSNETFSFSTITIFINMTNRWWKCDDGTDVFGHTFGKVV